jgi:hypothetical protein
LNIVFLLITATLMLAFQRRHFDRHDKLRRPTS